MPQNYVQSADNSYLKKR